MIKIEKILLPKEVLGSCACALYIGNGLGLYVKNVMRCIVKKLEIIHELCN